MPKGVVRVRPNLYEGMVVDAEIKEAVGLLYRNLAANEQKKLRGLQEPEIFIFASPKQAAQWIHAKSLLPQDKIGVWGLENYHGESRWDAEEKLSKNKEAQLRLQINLDSLIHQRLDTEMSLEYDGWGEILPNVKYNNLALKASQWTINTLPSEPISHTSNRAKAHSILSQKVYYGWYFKEMVVYSFPPTYNFTHLVDGTPLLHNEEHPVVQYQDGWNSYFLNDILVPATLVRTPADQIPVADWMVKYKNVEVRKELAKKVGPERIVQAFNAKILDQWEEYTLYRFRTQHLSRPAHCLKMLNPSTSETHWEYVHWKCNTVQAALAWRLGGIKWNPIQLT